MARGKELTEEEEDALLEKLLNPSEKLRRKLLHEEFKLRKRQPQSWVKTKYRKNILVKPKEEKKEPPLPPGYAATVEAQLKEFAERERKRAELKARRVRARLGAKSGRGARTPKARARARGKQRQKRHGKPKRWKRR